MLILHTSDWHLGRSLHGADLTEQTDAFLTWLVDLVRDRGVDAVLVSGDVFDRAVPSVTALRQLTRVLPRLCALASVVMVPGNHDSASRLGFAAGMYRDELRIVSDPLAVGEAVELDGRDGVRVLVYPVPYLEPDLVRTVLADTPEPLARSHEAVMAQALRRVRWDLLERRTRGEDSPAVAVVHAFVTGGQPCDSERDIQVGGVSSVPAGLFDTLGAPPEDPGDASGGPTLRHGLDYVAAGHLHRPQDIAGAHVPIRYAGSPVAYSFSEAGATKSVTLLDVGERGVRGLDVVPVPTTRRLTVLRGTIADLLCEDHADATEDWVSATVTDDARPEAMVTRIRQRFPHALVVVHEPTHRVDIAGPGRLATRRDPREVSRDFFAAVGARALTAEEATVLDDTWTALRTAGAS